MARPRKIDAETMLLLVNDYYESCGDASRLKCSLLEAYAIKRGFDIKAYDFRRSAEVRQRINELKDISLLPTGSGGVAYKGLDVDALINNARNKESLKNSLIELDEIWRRIYDRYIAVSKENDALAKNARKCAEEMNAATHKASELGNEVAQLKKERKDRLLENRYLKKKIKEYLYPAIANEILINERVLDQADTAVPPKTLKVLTEPTMPLPFSGAVSADRSVVSREESLLNRMFSQALGEPDNK